MSIYFRRSILNHSYFLDNFSIYSFFFIYSIYPFLFLGYREPVEHTRWVLPSQPNFLHTYEPEIEPLTTCLKGPNPLPLGPLHYWYSIYISILLTLVKIHHAHHNIMTNWKIIIFHIKFTKSKQFVNNNFLFFFTNLVINTFVHVITCTNVNLLSKKIK
jgi:hypothetical protein